MCVLCVKREVEIDIIVMIDFYEARVGDDLSTLSFFRVDSVKSLRDNSFIEFTGERFIISMGLNPELL